MSRSPRRPSTPRKLSDSGPRERKRVLIVDDDEDTRELYAWCLRAAGWYVEAVPNAEDVHFIAAAFKPDVIVMDLCMPGIGGGDATRRLKGSALTQDIPVVAVSGLDRAQAEQVASDAGCAELASKPCEPEELRQLLERVLLEHGA